MPGETDLIKHRVKLTLDEPIWSRPYPVPYYVRETLRGAKRHAQSEYHPRVKCPYSSPIVIVKIRDDTNRLCVDFRKPNKITEVDLKQTNTVAKSIQNLSTDKWFLNIDLTK